MHGIMQRYIGRRLDKRKGHLVNPKTQVAFSPERRNKSEKEKNGSTALHLHYTSHATFLHFYFVMVDLDAENRF